MKIKGWKVFNSNLKCRDFQFEVGKRYKHKGSIEMCASGFHFHENRSNLFNYYDFEESNRICEIIARGDVETGDDKSVTNDIEIVKELNWNEVLNLINLGTGNSGKSNSGNWNSGNGNSGNWNSGNWNSGNRNSGNRNSGNRNSGNRNSGNWNSGNWNSGNFNTTNYCSGIFNSKEQKVPLFNGSAYVLMSDFKNTKAYSVLYDTFPLIEWIGESNMTDQEKIDNPKFFDVKGYLKKNTYKYACGKWWESLSDSDKEVVKDIEGFDAIIFEEITGIKL